MSNFVSRVHEIQNYCLNQNNIERLSKNIYLMKIDGSELRQITNHNSDDYEPTFSSDGAFISFTSERDGNKEIYIFIFR